MDENSHSFTRVEATQSGMNQIFNRVQNTQWLVSAQYLNIWQVSVMYSATLLFQWQYSKAVTWWNSIDIAQCSWRWVGWLARLARLAQLQPCQPRESNILLSFEENRVKSVSLIFCLIAFATFNQYFISYIALLCRAFKTTRASLQHPRWIITIFKDQEMVVLLKKSHTLALLKKLSLMAQEPFP